MRVIAFKNSLTGSCPQHGASMHRHAWRANRHADILRCNRGERVGVVHRHMSFREGDLRMVALTFGVSRLLSSAKADAKRVDNSRGFFVRLLDALAESQMKRAQRDIVRYRHLVPLDHPLRDTLVPRKE